MKKEEEEIKYKVSTVATKVDPWLQYAGWEEVLAGPKYRLIKTTAFAATAIAEETKLEPVL